MTLRLCDEVSAADWVACSVLPWEQLVGFGPDGFAAHARLRLLPDPAYPGQSENDVAADWRSDRLPMLFEALAAHTDAADDCCFCVWEGLDQQDTVRSPDDGSRYAGPPAAGPAEDDDAGPGLAPHPEVSMVDDAPRVVLPHRAYRLFRGPLSALGAWDDAEGWRGPHRLMAAEPAFVWPADRTWCVAKDVDAHWAGIGSSASVIGRLLTDSRLDVVAAHPAAEQPRYR